VCGSHGEVIYRELDDVLFGAPGKWSVSRCINGQCGLLWLDPQPIEDDIGRAYADYYTHASASGGSNVLRTVFRQVKAGVLRSRLGYRNAASGFAWRLTAPLGHLYPGGSDALAASAMFVPAPHRASSLLDVGCGSGDFMATMRDLGWRVTGVETDGRAVARALDRGLDMRHGGLKQVGFVEASFDTVTMAHVIEHVHDPVKLLAECGRILKPLGTLVILTPNSASWGHQHFGRDWRGLEPPRHMRIHNRLNLRRLLETAGLQPVRVATLAINANAVWRASAAIRRTRAARGARVAPSNRMLSGMGPQVAERLRLTLDPDAGEDLLAIATRAA
jgi:2-polyprenyl-3-methyl-5-hydroxy-6-metoxy-1,4-benzoquinol methylase